MNPVTVVQLVAAVAALLPQIAADAEQVYAVLTGAATAVRNAQAGDGTISAADWATLDSSLNGDLARLHAAAQAG